MFTDATYELRVVTSCELTNKRGQSHGHFVNYKWFIQICRS